MSASRLNLRRRNSSSLAPTCRWERWASNEWLAIAQKPVVISDVDLASAAVSIIRQYHHDNASSKMIFSNATDTRTPVPENWHHFRTKFFRTRWYTLGLILSTLLYLYPIHFIAIKTTNNTTYISKQHNWRSSDQSVLVILVTWVLVPVLLRTRFRGELTDLTMTDQLAGVDIDGPQLKTVKLEKNLIKHT